jgi:hypothetical protein
MGYVTFEDSIEVNDRRWTTGVDGMRTFVMAATGAALIALAPINDASALTVSPFSFSGNNVQLNNDPLDVGETGFAVGLLYKIGGLSDLQDSFTFTPAVSPVRVTIRALQIPPIPGSGTVIDIINGAIADINANNPLNVSGQTYSLGGGPTPFSFGSSFTVPASAGSVNTLALTITVPSSFGGVAYRVNVTPVPLPGALPLMGAALAGLALVRHRRNAQARLTQA